MLSLGRILSLPRQHGDVRSMTAWQRRRIYGHLLSLVEEEERVKELPKLPVAPRLSVVDEERVTNLRPRDRVPVAPDPQMRGARDQHQRRGSKGWQSG